MKQIMYYNPEIVPYISIKLKEPFNANFNKLEAEIKNHYPESEYNLVSYKSIADEQNSNTKIIQRIFLSVAVIIALIAFVGLTGFLRDEMQRRSKEIAIRKVNGSEATGILELLVKDVLYVAVVAVLIGVVAAWYVNGMWMDLFAEHVPLSWAAYLLIAIANLAVIVACVLWKSWKIANENPVNSIKSE